MGREAMASTRPDGGAMPENTWQGNPSGKTMVCGLKDQLLSLMLTKGKPTYLDVPHHSESETHFYL